MEVRPKEVVNEGSDSIINGKGRQISDIHFLIDRGILLICPFILCINPKLVGASFHQYTRVSPDNVVIGFWSEVEPVDNHQLIGLCSNVDFINSELLCSLEIDIKTLSFDIVFSDFNVSETIAHLRAFVVDD